MASVVYMAGPHGRSASANNYVKVERLCDALNLKKVVKKGEPCGIKLHFGEYGNNTHLNPGFVRRVVNKVSAAGAKPFLTDSTTLYSGMRNNAVDHLKVAYLHGFTPAVVDAPVIIADGLFGENGVPVRIDCKHFAEVYIADVIDRAPSLVVLSHFKGHEMAGFGGALKNIGMGCGSRAGKMEMHSEGKPYVSQEKCIGCGMCTKVCAHNGTSVTDHKAFINQENCVGCGRCIGVCPKDAIEPTFGKSNDVLNYKMAEYSKAVLQGRPHFHISIVCDVSPNCDCHAENDIPIIPNVGMFASFDPVALDVACADACNRQPVIEGSVISGGSEAAADGHGHDHFHLAHPDTNWKSCVEHAEKIGIGSRDYELIEV